MNGCFVDFNNAVAQPSREHDPHVVHRSGQLAPASGIYLVKHARDGPTREEIFISGTRLPTCSDCELPLLFSLIREVPYIGDDADFSWEVSRAAN